MTVMQLGRRVAAILAATLSFSGVIPALAQTEPDVPTVSLKPAGSKPTDPNLGGWFVFELNPGDSARGVAEMTNVASVAQTVKLYFGDLVFTKRGEPQVVDQNPKDAGSWGSFPASEITVGPNSKAEAEFFVRVPPTADPGDHLGVVIAESRPQSGQIKVVKRVATRMYVTVPGETVRDFEIEKVDVAPDSALFPRRANVTVVLRNTGRIRLSPKVTVKGVSSKGPDILLSQSVNKYVADIPMPWYGGRVKVPVEAVAERGLIARASPAKFVFPFAPAVLVMLITAAGLLFYKWWNARGGKYAALQADIRRLESLVAHRNMGTDRVLPQPEYEEDEVAALLAAVKRARRTGSQSSLERLAFALADFGGVEALGVIVDAAIKAQGKTRSDLIRAARKYPASQLTEAMGRMSLPEDLVSKLTEKKSVVAKPKAPAATKPSRTGRRTPKTHSPKK